jgi:hypothetical protein
MTHHSWAQPWIFSYGLTLFQFFPGPGIPPVGMSFLVDLTC